MTWSVAAPAEIGEQTIPRIQVYHGLGTTPSADGPQRRRSRYLRPVISSRPSKSGLQARVLHCLRLYCLRLSGVRIRRHARVEGETLTTIGVISDTHGLLRPRAVDLLRGSDVILHAGDMGSDDIIPALQRLAPVTAVRGNVDHGAWARAFAVDEALEIDGRSFFMLHDLNDLTFDPAEAGFDMVISGHTHRPKLETVGGVRYLNPGSAGPRRFKLPISLARIVLAEGTMETELLTIEP